MQYSIAFVLHLDCQSTSATCAQSQLQRTQVSACPACMHCCPFQDNAVVVLRACSSYSAAMQMLLHAGFCAAVTVVISPETYKWGQIWNMVKAWLWQIPYFQGGDTPRNSNCPLCGEHDCGGHILGKCSHPEMKRMHIHRHDEAARIIINVLTKATMEASSLLLMWAAQPHLQIWESITNDPYLGLARLYVATPT